MLTKTQLCKLIGAASILFTPLACGQLDKPNDPEPGELTQPVATANTKICSWAADKNHRKCDTDNYRCEDAMGCKYSTSIIKCAGTAFPEKCVVDQIKVCPGKAPEYLQCKDFTNACKEPSNKCPPDNLNCVPKEPTTNCLACHARGKVDGDKDKMCTGGDCIFVSPVIKAPPFCTKTNMTCCNSKGAEVAGYSNTCFCQSGKGVKLTWLPDGDGGQYCVCAACELGTDPACSTTCGTVSTSTATQ